MVQALSAISERKAASTLVQDEVNFEVKTETGSLTDYIVGPANPASPYEYLLSGNPFCIADY